MSSPANKDEKKEKKKCGHCSGELPTNAQKCGFCEKKICNKCDATNCPGK